MSPQLVADVLSWARGSLAMVRALESQAEVGNRRRARRVRHAVWNARAALVDLYREAERAVARDKKRGGKGE